MMPEHKKALLELDLFMSKMEEDIIEYPKKHYKMIMTSYLLDGTQVVVCVASYLVWIYMVFTIKLPFFCAIIILPLTWATLNSIQEFYKTYTLQKNMKKGAAEMKEAAKKRREVFDKQLGIEQEKLYN